LGAPPLVAQLEIFAISSIPCSFGFPSSLVSPNWSAFLRSHFIKACFTVLPLNKSGSVLIACHALIAAASFGA